MIDNLKIADISSLIKKWKESVIGLDQMLYEDAKKEIELLERFYSLQVGCKT